MKIPEADSVISWIAKMRNFYDVPDDWLLNEGVSAFEILYIALADSSYKGYQQRLEEKLASKNK